MVGGLLVDAVMVEGFPLVLAEIVGAVVAQVMGHAEEVSYRPEEALYLVVVAG